MAHKAAVSRNIVGGLFTAVGLADLAWFLATGPNNDLNFLGYLGALYATYGIVFLVLKSPAEREYEDFEKSKAARLPGAGVALEMFPMPTGAVAGLRWTF